MSVLDQLAYFARQVIIVAYSVLSWVRVHSVFHYEQQSVDEKKCSDEYQLDSSIFYDLSMLVLSIEYL